MKDKAFTITNTTKEEYLKWCKDNNLPSYKVSSKQKYFALIKDQKLVKERSTGKLLRKRPRRK